MKYQIHLAILIIPSLLFSLACNSNSDAQLPLSDVPYSILLSGTNTLSGEFENRKIEVFRDQISLNSSLALYVTSIREFTVDFSSSQVVLINMGERNSGGCSVEVETVVEYSDHIVLETKLVIPGENCAVTLSLTSPYIFVEIESTKELLIKEELEIEECS